MVASSETKFPSASPLQRGISASASCLIVVAAFSLFQFSQHDQSKHHTAQRESQLVWFQLPTPALVQVATQKEDKPRPAPQAIAKIKPTPTFTATPAITSAPMSPSTQETKNDFDDAFKSQHAIDRAMANKSANIDSTSIQRAYQDSKTELQKQADKSGTPLADARLTQQEKFQQAANRAAKPDCLRQGGSLLSLFVVAYQVATDHCK